MTFSLDFSEGGPYANMGSPAQSLGFPGVLSLDVAFRMINEAKESAPLIGVDGECKPVVSDLDSESPHILISASTGGGKSVTARGLLATSVYKGAVGVILDIKRCSHRWAYDNPRIGYAKTLPEIGKALVEMGKEVHRRNEIIEKWDGPMETAPLGPRIVCVFEETNATMTQLRQLDKRIPSNKYGAIEALNDILLLGRAAKVHMIGIMQFPDFRILPQAMVEQFSTRIMIRYTSKAWVKIAYDCGLPQTAPDETGRGMLIAGGRARETQFLYLTEQECQALALGPQNALQSSSVPMIGA